MVAGSNGLYNVIMLIHINKDIKIKHITISIKNQEWTMQNVDEKHVNKCQHLEAMWWNEPRV